MLFASLANLSQNNVASDRFAKALAWLESTDLASLEPGRHDICGDEVFANVQELTTVNPGDKNYEAHRKYADIHYVISGVEKIGVAPVDECEAVCDFNEADDFGLFANPAREAWVTLHEGELCVTPPADAHKPGCCTDEPAALKKICVKVLVD